MSKFTKWKYKKHQVFNKFLQHEYVISSEDSHIAKTYTEDSAKLISKAPEMLELLLEIRTIEGEWTPENSVAIDNKIWKLTKEIEG